MSDRSLRELERRVATGEVGHKELRDVRHALGLCGWCGANLIGHRIGGCPAYWVDSRGLGWPGINQTWRDKVRPYVACVLDRAGDRAPEEQKRRALLLARPHQVKNFSWVAKVWYSEIRSQMIGLAKSPPEAPGQAHLFGEA